MTPARPVEPSLVPDAQTGSDSSGSGRELRSDCPPPPRPSPHFPTLSDSGRLASGPHPCAGLFLPEVLLYSFLAYLSAFFSHLQGQVADYLVLTVVNAPDVGTLTWTGLRHVGAQL